MTIPLAFPDWVPWWAQLLLIVLAILLGLAFLLMPFSVFGVKSRLEGVEARLDEIQGEIRSLALRLPERARGAVFEDEPLVAPRDAAGPSARPPIPPAPYQPERGGREPLSASRSRAEPRLGPGR